MRNEKNGDQNENERERVKRKKVERPKEAGMKKRKLRIC